MSNSMLMRASDHAGGSYLRAYLSHLDEWLAAPDVTDIFINGPGEIWVETTGAPARRVPVPELDAATLRRLARQIAGRSQQGINRQSPLLAAMLPDGERVQVVAPPATRDHVAIAIRKQAIRKMTLEECEANGLFARVHLDPAAEQAAADRILADRLAAHDMPGLLRAAVSQRRNIIVSGGTATGKTTFLNMLVRLIDADERIVAIEDTPEIELDRPNAVGLIAGTESDSTVTADQLLRAALRMRPSRIMLGELRGVEAYSFLRAINTGHPGSMTTLHADSPQRAIEQLALMVLQAGTTLSRADVTDYVRSSIDVIVQLTNSGGRRLVSGVHFRTAER